MTLSEITISSPFQDNFNLSHFAISWHNLNYNIQEIRCAQSKECNPCFTCKRWSII